MPVSSNPISVRRITSDDLSPLFGWRGTEPVAWVDDLRLRRELDSRNYRPEWAWVAVQDGAVIGRALWWGGETAERPTTLDCLLLRDASDQPEQVGAALIARGIEAFGPGSALEFNVDVPAAWADDPAAVAAVRWREHAARAGGFSRTTERVSYRRSGADPRPARSTRLRFEAAPDATFRTMFARVADGTLDAHTLHMVADEGVEALADDDLQFYLSLPGERASWRVAVVDGRTHVGFMIPTRTAYDASISYLGILPEHRGNGYVHDVLAEMVHVHHDDDQDQIVGTTDAANTPMRAAFIRAGFHVTRRRIVHEQ
ncbi:GNAT family N-acetyltransferase [Allobranchiibius sp. CTAmp26]|uniref:GNAT family N-acetyltransferase n=1 Tax=Allobranchiibius sp. CTAmp26 TaxID=2815214 RepID=UPI001AA17DA6|nr:GNAT family N-acetyltransferase [Allobranchiibius sp. CTAmp26]MBO1755009.1 hypothetical protein [Allobranchiibius sp. CTAmp26]